MADLIFLSPWARVFALELKAPNGRQREGQVEFQEWCASSGAEYQIASTVDEAIDIIAAWGALRGRLKVMT